MSVYSMNSAPAHLERHDNEYQIARAHNSAKSPKSLTEVAASKRERKPTEKWKNYQLGLKEANKISSYKKLKKKIEQIYDMLRDNSNPDVKEFENARDNLDLLRDDFDTANYEYNLQLNLKEQREASSQWFDIRDREYVECRVRICEQIHALERKSHKARSVQSSVRSRRSKSISSKASSLSKHSLSLARVDAATKAAKLEAELQHLDQERAIRRLQLEKEIAIANAQENAIKRIIDEENRIDGELKGVKTEIKTENNIKRTNSELKPNCPQFIPKTPSCPPEIPSQPVTQQISALNTFNSTFQEIVNLQTKQTELNSCLIHQQNISHLPVKEPPTFSGDPFEFPAFVTAFDCIISEEVSSDHDRLYFLEKYTKGKANDIVKGFLAVASENSYKEARKLLKDRFGNPLHVAESYISRLRHWPQINDTDNKGLQEFSDFLVRCEEAAKSVKCVGELDSAHTIRQLCAKLPSFCAVKWCRQAREIREKSSSASNATFGDFVKFVKNESELANDPVFSLSAIKMERKRGFKLNEKENVKKPNLPKKGHGSFATSISEQTEQNVQNSVRCPLCEGSHSLVKCRRFINKSIEGRSEFVRSSGLCFRCFTKGHLSNRCSNTVACSECGKRHHTLLHGAKPKTKKESLSKSHEKKGDNKHEGEEMKEAVDDSENANVSATHTNTNSRYYTTNSKIVPVILYHKDNPEKEVRVYALLDDASDTTFITDKVQRQLGISGVETKLKLSTMLGREEISACKVEGLIVQRLDKQAQAQLPRVYARDNIPCRRDQVPTPEVADKWPHLRKVKDKIPPYQAGLQFGLLIGCNCPKAIKPKEVILGKGEEPYAVRTLLGWCIVGPVASASNATDDPDAGPSTCNFIATREIIPAARLGPKFALNTMTKEEINPSVVKQLFELDFSEKHSSNQSLSRDDRKFLEIAERGIHQLDNKHYELPLPLKNGSINLPNNRDMAVRRMNHLKRKFERNVNTKYREDYVAFMNKVIENGFAEKVVENQDPSVRENMKGKIWYIPHHGVYHPKKPGKIRVVFDCAAQYQNESLNKHLLQGPDLTNNLTGVLCRFRQDLVAFMCDIEGMFHQVKVNAEHRDLLRFLRWENGDTSKEPEEFRMTVHLFGAASSPSCANFALKTTADDNENALGNAAADFLRKDFYVDDGLKSVQSADKAVNLIKNTKEMCSRGGFNLHKFVSNSKDVIRSIPKCCRADGVNKIDLNLDSLPVERALGIQWCVESDSFQFPILLEPKPCTRRGILSTVSSIFDPIGFVAPLLLEGKSILQALCRQSIGWDDIVPDEARSRWEEWKLDLVKMEGFSVPRCYKPLDFGRVVKTELHHFSDASVMGYGQCSYLRFVDEDDRIHCAFVMGKSRVAPLKSVTIPRLELTAAVCSVRVGAQLRKELDLEIDREIFWTDSKVVLGYIANETRRFHIFVANRVQEIQDHTLVEQWRYVESKFNPEDEASRGVKAKEISESKWLSGPSFLWEPEDLWPSNHQENESIHQLSLSDPEVRKAVACSTFIVGCDESRSGSLVEDRLSYFSNWHRGKQAIALCLRYVRKLRALVQRTKLETTMSPDLTVSELRAAENLIIRMAQDTAFPKVLAALKDKARNPNVDPTPRKIPTHYVSSTHFLTKKESCVSEDVYDVRTYPRKLNTQLFYLVKVT